MAGIFLACLLHTFNSCAKPEEDNIIDPLAAEQYFTFSIGGLPGYAKTPEDSVGARRHGNQTTLYGTRSDGGIKLLTKFTGDPQNGTYDVDYMSLYVNSNYYVTGTSPLQVFLTGYGNVGDYITGSYNGWLRDSTGTISYSINGLFKLKRLE